MTYKLLITQDANNDIDEIVSYIVNKLKNPVAARNLLSEIESALKRYHLTLMLFRCAVISVCTTADTGK